MVIRLSHETIIHTIETLIKEDGLSWAEAVRMYREETGSTLGDIVRTGIGDRFKRAAGIIK